MINSSKMFSIVFFWSLIFFFQPQNLMADDENSEEPFSGSVDTLDGVYKGTMNLTDDEVRTIPLSISLTITNQTAPNPPDTIFDDQKLIKGTFLLDFDGGPYVLKSVTYTVETGRIEFYYQRSTSFTPDLWFEGQFKGARTIEGTVNSSIKGGQIGTFQLKKSSDVGLEKIPMYRGTWKGVMTWIRPEENNRKTPMNLSIYEAPKDHLNPANMEIEETKGLGGFFNPNDARPENPTYKLDIISIDYLRRRMELTYLHPIGNTKIELICTIDAEGKTITGDAQGALGGKWGEFTLTKEASPQ